MSGDAETQPMKQTALYVGDLHPSVSDSILFSKFNEFGSVLFARVCRDLASRESLGYGYVNFRDPKDAEVALEHLNYSLVYGRPIRLMWSQRDPSLRKSGKGNVFIKNLDKSIIPVELYDTFGQFGKILSCKIAMDEKGNSKGYGFVHFSEESDADSAINFINGKKLKDRIVYVGHFIPRSERRSSDGACKFNNCYVKNFGDDMDDERLKTLFSKYGDIKSACVMKDDKGVSKGFGFVCFLDPTHAEAAAKELNGTEFKDKTLYVGRAQRKEERQEELKQRFEKQRTQRQSRYDFGINLYVKNLDDSIDDETLTNAFKTFGEITSAKVMRDVNGQSRGFGFVCFRTKESAAVAVSNLNNAMLGNKPLYVAIAQRKEDRRAQLTAEYQARVDSIRTANMYPLHHTPMPFLPSSAAFPQSQRMFGSILNNRPRWNQQMMPGAMGGNAGASQMSYMVNQQGAGAGGGPQATTGGYANMQMRSQAGSAMNRAGAGGQQAPNMMRQQPQSAGMKMMPNVVNATTGIPPRMSMSAAAMIRGPMQQGVAGSAVPSQPAVRSNQNSRNVAAAPVANAASTAAAAGPQLDDDQKSVIGNRIFKFITKTFSDSQNAAKLTGVMLSLNPKELNSLLEDEEALKAKVEEARRLLWQHQMDQPPAGDVAAADKKAAADVAGKKPTAK